jgi:hypothetical protein
MPKTDEFAETFTALRALLQRHGKRLLTTVDKPGDFQLGSPGMTDRIGRPLFVAAVQIKKRYVSFHLMPIYVNPALLASVSPALKTRMQGKACFNFTTIDADQLKELAALTRTGIDGFKNLDLPWARAVKPAASTPAPAPARARTPARTRTPTLSPSRTPARTEARARPRARAKAKA